MSNHERPVDGLLRWMVDSDYANERVRRDVAQRVVMGTNLGDAEPRCTLCDEVVDELDEPAVMVPPANAGAGHLVHAECGLRAGWEVA